MKIRYSFKEILDVFVCDFFDFIKQALFFTMAFGVALMAVVLVAVAICFGLSQLGVPRDAYVLVFKIFVTVGGIVPAVFHSFLCYDDSQHEETNSNPALGFVGWGLVALFLWVIM